MKQEEAKRKGLRESVIECSKERANESGLEGCKIKVEAEQVNSPAQADGKSNVLESTVTWTCILDIL